jgi:hypothetical protein
MSLFQNQKTGRYNRSCLGVGTSVRGEDIRKGYRRVNMVEIHVFMYVNGKMRLNETIIRMGGIKENDGRGEFN